MTFSESSGQVPGANVPLIFSLETVNIEKFGPEVTIHCPNSSLKKSGKMDFLTSFFASSWNLYKNELMIPPYSITPRLKILNVK